MVLKNNGHVQRVLPDKTIEALPDRASGCPVPADPEPLTRREWESGGRPRVVVAMSSGVDSSTAAALLVEQGYDVIGVMMRIWGEATSGGPSVSPATGSGRGPATGSGWGPATGSGRGPARSSGRGPATGSPDASGQVYNRCCTPQAVADARNVARHLGIPFYLLDFQAEFKKYVVDYFVAEYAAGRTPSPCIMCNRHIRFRFLLQRALAFEADYLATGHYARVRKSADGRYQLLKGVDAQKDQSYFLYMLGQSQLRHLLFPVGSFTKDQVRAMARARDLPVAEKAESQELCFVADGDYRRFIQDYAPEAVMSGPILDRSGQVLGQHAGLPMYTIGQRRGLGIALGEPVYVLNMDRTRNALVVGPDQALHQRELTVHSVSYVAGEPPSGEMAVTAKIRSTARETPASLVPLDGARARLVFDVPVRAVAPGQAAVFFDGDVVVGGGIIS